MSYRPRLLIITLALVSLLAATFAISAADQPQLGSPPVFPPEESTSLRAAQDTTVAAYLPIVKAPSEAGPWVNTADRYASKQYYLFSYGSDTVPIEWTGNHGSCIPGSTSAAYLDSILERINYFRSMAGLPQTTGFNGEYNQKAQAAALMMSVNKKLSHSPDSGWQCYSQDGRDGAGSSNLYLGRYGPSAITGYMYDPGANNYPVGHRRWILYPQTQQMGVGNVRPAGAYPPANALWVFDKENMWGPRPETRDAFVAWPPRGYMPYLFAFPRWSFSYPGADFSSAKVTMVREAAPLSITILAVRNGYGENTLVWEPDANTQEQPSQDVLYKVAIENVVVKDQLMSFQYDVILFDPGN